MAQTVLDINPPTIPDEEVASQWEKICKDLASAISNDKGCKKRCTVLHYKVYDVNNKRLQEKGFWTTNHITTCPVIHRHEYVTAVSWA